MSPRSFHLHGLVVIVLTLAVGLLPYNAMTTFLTFALGWQAYPFIQRALNRLDPDWDGDEDDE